MCTFVIRVNQLSENLSLTSMLFPSNFEGVISFESDKNIQMMKMIERFHFLTSLLGPTEVNRMYVHSATSHGSTDNNIEKLIAGYPQKTIYQSLEEASECKHFHFCTKFNMKTRLLVSTCKKSQQHSSSLE
jgi:hypothetical protein